MSDYHSQTRAVPGTADMAVDAGLRSFMLGVYNKMALGLLLSATLAWVAANVPPITALVFGTPLYFVFAFGPIVLLLISSFAMRNPSPTAANLIYWSVVSMLGVSLGSILLTYGVVADGMTTIVKAFLITALTFGSLSLWGYTTKRDLTGMGNFLIMGVIGLLIAMIVNLFLKSSAMGFAISILGVLIFTGLTAYDTQKIKGMYDASDDGETMTKKGILGALNLYLDFINIFIFLLQLMGARKD